MFNLFDSESLKDRRAFLTLGGIGIGGLGFGTLPTLQANQSLNQHAHLTGKSVIYLFQQGGPSQLETFDPKPDAPDNVRTVTGVIPTALPSVNFGMHLPQLAKLADKLTIVRSFQTQNAGHNIRPIVGPDSLEANIGVHYARVVGTTRADTGIPTNAVIYPASVAEDVPGPQARGNLSATGPYSNTFVPFVPGGGGQFQKDMKLNLPYDRLDDRKILLQQLDTLKRRYDSIEKLEAISEQQRQAFEILLGDGVSKALDHSLEDSRTLASYDTSKYFQKGRWNSVSRGKAGYYDANAASIGKLLLLARRLCEAGCGFVTIHASYAGVWDMHADKNNLNMVDGMNAIGYSFDHAVSAFVKDLESRGLQDKIMLVCSGEMGRTPKLNKRGGRDHWAKLSPLLMYGGGLKEGQVIGKSDRQAGEPVTNNLTPKHLISTILNTLFDVGELRLVQGIPNHVLDLAQHAGIVEG